MFKQLFSHPWPLLGVLHIPALPGSPAHRLTMDAIKAHVLADAEALIRAGFEGIVLENFGDAPFFPEQVEPHTVAAMAVLADQVQHLARQLAPNRTPRLGINVLRNDARSAMAIAAMVDAAFVRVNVHIGAMVTDQGLIQGRAAETLRYRQALGSRVAVFADVLVKHATPLGTPDLVGTAKDTFLRGGADALIVSGRGTGEPTDLSTTRTLKTALPAAPLLIGSGLTLETLTETLSTTDGAIVGTALKANGDVAAPIDLARAQAFVAARDALLQRSV